MLMGGGDVVRLLTPAVRALSLAQLEGEASAGASEGDAALERWYREVRGRPLGALDVAAVARALRQRLQLPLVAARGIELLAQDPLAGDLYEGELLAALLGAVGALPPLGEAAVAALRRALEGALSASPPPDTDALTWQELQRDARALSLALCAPLELVCAAREGEPAQEVPLVEPVSIGSGPAATIRVATQRLAREHARLSPRGVAGGAQVELFGHTAHLNGAPLIERGELHVGDVLDLVGVRVTLRRLNPLDSGARLRALGLAHLMGDPEALATALQQLAQRLPSASPRAWLAAQDPPPPRHALADGEEEPWPPIKDMEGVLAAWEFMVEGRGVIVVSPWEPPELVAAFGALHAQLRRALSGGPVDEEARVGARVAAARLREALGPRRLLGASEIAVALRISDALAVL
jgi:hypothetical protein